MTSQLEADLRTVLRQCAGEIPDDAIHRVRGWDYHARGRSLKLRVAVGGASAAVLATAASVVLLTVGPGVQDAFASWTPTPTPPSSGQIAAAEAVCLQAIVALAQSGDAANNEGAFITTATAWQAEVEDVRGPFTLVALEASDGSSTDSASCLTGGSSWSEGPQIMMSDGKGMAIANNPSGATTPTQAQATISVSKSPPSGGTIGDLSTNWNSASNDDVAIGQTGSGVTGVTLVLGDGASVTATAANGYFAAWWPGDATATSAEVTTAQGTSTITIPST
jgi:hypothetical protein